MSRSEHPNPAKARVGGKESHSGQESGEPGSVCNGVYTWAVLLRLGLRAHEAELQLSASPPGELYLSVVDT